jgi:general secretion pathway protein N
MKRIWPLGVLGLLAYLVFAVTTLPASLVLARFAPLVNASGVEGTIWKGRAPLIQVGSANLGALTWDLHVLPLFMARLQADVNLTRSDGFARATVLVMRGNRIVLKELTASLPLSALPANIAPGGWLGTVNAKLSQLDLQDGWPRSIDGTADIGDLLGPASRPSKLGSYKVTFPSGSGGDEIVGGLSDAGGPLEISGNIRLKADRSYVVDGVVAARPDAPKSMADSLQYLGPPDAQGRRQFSFSGTL